MSDYEFIPVDVSSLEAELIALYEEKAGISIKPGSPEKLMIQWALAAYIQLRANINYTGNQNIPSRASGANLDALGELFFAQARPQAQPAVTTMRFSISEAQSSAILIPAGTRVSDTSTTLYWETTADAYVAIGNTYADVPVRCQTSGTVGNGWAIGQINTLVDIYDYYSECSNITASDGGADTATDAEYYELLRASMDAYSCAGSKGSYEYWVKTVSTEIADVVVNRPDDGCVAIYILMDDGSAASTEIKNAALAVCSADTVRPLTDSVSVEDPTEVSYNVTLTYYIPSNSSISSTVVQANVEAAVAEYTAWQAGKLGRDINPSYLIGLLMKAGIKRVVITAPTFTELSDGSDNSAPELASVGTVTITNGGYENE